MRKEKKEEIGMCQKQGNTCEKRKKKKQVCARGKEIHAKREKRKNRYVPAVSKHMRKVKKEEIGMCKRQRNTCEKRKKKK